MGFLLFSFHYARLPRFLEERRGGTKRAADCFVAPGLLSENLLFVILPTSCALGRIEKRRLALIIRRSTPLKTAPEE